ncbi:PLP-dependent aminotransferase family protein [Microbaculum marinum]|uniref:PLP-dependent aminotransferase family protein n=1 Tax=Microbaculum marinum TaxID=1764581 RepID=A0AAW9RL40_9HYPH
MGDEGTLISKVMAAIRRRVASRSLPVGAKLPSIRQMARTMQVSPATVVEAYERLAAEGLIRSRPGSGFFVASLAAPLDLSEIGPRLDRAIDPLWVSRQSLEAGEGDVKPGCGWLPPSWLPEAALRKALRGLSRASDVDLGEYSTPLGLAPLRLLVGRRLAETGVEAAPDQIMLTESGTQSIDLLCRLLLEPGDVVLLDDPCYFNFQALLRAHRVTVVSVAYTPSGPDLAQFETILAEHRPRLYITNSAVHNPTGATLSPVTAHRMLKLAEAYSLTIVEDEIFADFEDSPAPRLAAFDGLERVVQVGSFSKTLSASARCGFIAARRDWMAGLVDLKIATSFGGGRLSAALVLSVLRDGGYRRHLDGLRHRLAGARADVAARLGRLGIVPWLMPRAGMFLWCRLPDGLDSADVAREALAQNVVLAPGNAFSVSRSAGACLRFNVSQCDDRVFEVLEASLRGARARAPA